MQNKGADQLQMMHLKSILVFVFALESFFDEAAHVLLPSQRKPPPNVTILQSPIVFRIDRVLFMSTI